MTSPRENRPALLAAVLAQALPGAAPGRIAEAVTAMTAAAKAHKRAAEHECSYPTDDAWQRRTAARLHKMRWHAIGSLYRAVDGACAHVGAGHPVYGEDTGYTIRLPDCPGGRSLLLKFGGDPRGPCGVLFVSDRDGDSWDEHNGRRGWAIYE